MNKHGGYLGDQQDMLDFSININPLGMPEGVRRVIAETIDQLGRYPEITGVSARNKLAQVTGVSNDQLILGNGAIELIYLFVKSLRPQKAMIVTPTFNEYVRALTMHAACEIKSWRLKPEENFYLDDKAFIDAIWKWQPEVVFLCNPNNPTGKFFERTALQEMMMAAPEETVWFIDESFIEFSGREGMKAFLLEGKRKLFLLKSLTKFFGVPGLRIGYGIGSAPIIKQMAAYKEPWTVNAFALAAAQIIYDDDAFIEKTKAYIASERQRVRVAVEKLPGIQVFDSAADFHLYRIDFKTGELQAALNQRLINIRTCEDFPGLEDYFFRASIKKPEDNDRFIAALSEILLEKQE